MTVNPDGTLLLYASDLQRFAACKHAIHLDLRKAFGEDLESAPDTEDAKLLSKLGDQHELAYLTSLQEAGKNVVLIEREGNAVAETVAALHKGVDVIYQGALQGPAWKGYVDFLERIETPSDLGSYSYEVVDTKLKRVPDPKHILQLVVYSDLLAQVQGRQPEYGHLQLGLGDRSSHRLSEYANYVRQLQGQLVQFWENSEGTTPRRCPECELCKWRQRCTNQWIEEDSLYMVAGIRKQQIMRLEHAGIRTMEGLAALQDQDRIDRIAPKTLQNLRIQAQLQAARRSGGEPTTLLRPHIKGKGFDLLPEPDPGDLFYDIEGDPHYRENGEERLEYLHGIWYQGNFKSIWAHNHSEERQALLDLFAFFQKQIEDFPNAHIYHYAPYEMTALRRLTTKYSFGEEILDGWQREKRFVDLYAVVRGSIFASEENYSLKSLETFYMENRTGSVTTASGSIIAYHNWRMKVDTDDPSATENLKELEYYNQVDCESTEKLRDWLIPLRSPLVESEPAQLGEALTDHSRRRAQDNETFKQKVHQSQLSSRLQKTMIDLGLFHYREMKPQAWAVFDASRKSFEEIVENTDCLAGLQAIGKPYPVKRSVEREYSFPVQFTRLAAEKSACILREDGTIATVYISKLSHRNHRISLIAGHSTAKNLQDRLDLLPSMPIPTAVIEYAIRSLIGKICSFSAPPAAIDILERNPPNLKVPSVLQQKGTSTIDRMKQAVQGMKSTVLTVQGPPGTGKTFVAARAILSLVEKGHRIAVSSNSHEAIRNVLIGCVNAAKDQASPNIVHKESAQSAKGTYPGIKTTKTNKDPDIFHADIVGGTAWLFCRPEMEDRFDYLFVDEAGQVSLANLLGMSMCAKNIVLIGDPCQLPQVIQASHPAPANLSCLEWILGSNKLVKPGRGIFLSETWRMHPKLCHYNSSQFYEGRLLANPDTKHQAIQASPLPEAGAYLIPVSHREPRMQQCEEEGKAIRAVIMQLLDGSWRDRHKRIKPIEFCDIIVVAPFNAQVNMLREFLPEEIRVGTVDKFQGQEAAISLISMTSTSADESPRGMDFLLSRERINVAISRAKVLSLLFASPRLLTSTCKTTDQIRLVNALCALDRFDLKF